MSAAFGLVSVAFEYLFDSGLSLRNIWAASQLRSSKMCASACLVVAKFRESARRFAFEPRAQRET
eukprot:11220046-Lingulodinium_polyedra.AAC.1